LSGTWACQRYRRVSFLGFFIPIVISVLCHGQLFRKAQEMTQTQLAVVLGISQQTIAHYEVGRLRISVELLTLLAKTLAVNLEELIEGPATNSATKRGPTSLLQRQIEQISQLPRTKQKFVSEMLETVIQQANS